MPRHRTKEFVITIDTWTRPHRRRRAASSRCEACTGVTGVALLSPRRITVLLDLFDSKTGAHITDVSNVIRGDLDAFAAFADNYFSLTYETYLVDID
ncbi:hypothetical protein [Amycolatopsis saalfeldensis]|uniref:Uncharacterized protein n=1 Tax=Amycolatopsis saalfeldensis TaxID=394193 RepID=A0A1H8YQG0_9PSEU|nr:hypothetical protein [Amycolatopsis saalfeldensis]SEP54444.1 hypothetical protein SAMN04489732_14720 [Amycolatopsis saalfeldensis]